MARIFLVAKQSGEGQLTEPTAAARIRDREPLFMPHCRHPNAPLSPEFRIAADMVGSSPDSLLEQRKFEPLVRKRAGEDK
jgi:hypothetical protein